MSGNEKGSGFLAKTANFAGKLGGKAIELAKIAKLSAEISSEKEKIRNTQLEIGKTYFENYADNPHPNLNDCCNKIKESLDIIDQKKLGIEELRAKDDKEDDQDSID